MSCTAHEQGGGEHVFCLRVAPSEGVCLVGEELRLDLERRKKISDILWLFSLHENFTAQTENLHLKE